MGCSPAKGLVRFTDAQSIDPCSGVSLRRSPTVTGARTETERVPLSSLLAILSAATFGAGDFLGGLASRRSGPLRVVAVSQLYGLILIGLLLPVFPPDGVLRG